MRAMRKYNFNFRMIKKGGNVKLGNMGTISKLMGNTIIDCGKEGYIVGSCGGYCNGCANDCYVKKSYRYPSVRVGHGRTTKAFRKSIMKVFEDMHKQLTGMKKKFNTVRINQSGELESKEEFASYCNLARLHPETIFYIYTKAYDLIEWALIANCVPSNLVINVSIWHEYGIDFYTKYSHIPNVKAFVYCDDYDYSIHGLEIKSMCPAYDRAGKMNHGATCDKCHKCFNDRPNNKINGSWAH